MFTRILLAGVTSLSPIAAANASSAALQGLREVRPFPMRELPRGARDRELVLEPDAAAIDELQQHRSLQLGPIVLPDGRAVDLLVERVDLERLAFGIRVDGRPADELLGMTGLSLWMGSIAGDPASSVVLSFSKFGSRGWIEKAGAETQHLLVDSGVDETWALSRSRWRSGSDVQDSGAGLGNFCSTPSEPADAKREPPSGNRTAMTGPHLCMVAIECDYQLFTRFNNLLAELTYVTSLLGAVSARYTQQLGLRLTYPIVNLWTTPDDPWQAQDNGGQSQEVLDELEEEWDGDWAIGLVHLMSGADLGGGRANMGGVCDPFERFSVSGNLTGQTPIPVVQGPLTWDFKVIAHELAHVFGVRHTHDECPPLDRCAPSEHFGICQFTQVCTNEGTLMSYCHVCPGGMNNITTYFHSNQISRFLDLIAESACVYACFDSVQVTCQVPGENFLTLRAGVAGVCEGGVVFLNQYDCQESPIQIVTPVTLMAPQGPVTIR